MLQAEDADQAIVLAKSEKPALILMDVSLPGMDGLVATAILKRDPQTSDIPLIALTANAMKGDKERALAAGFSTPVGSYIILGGVTSGEHL